MILFQSVEESVNSSILGSRRYCLADGAVCNEQDFLKANGPVMCKAQRSSNLIRCLHFFFFLLRSDGMEVDSSSIAGQFDDADVDHW